VPVQAGTESSPRFCVNFIPMISVLNSVMNFDGLEGGTPFQTIKISPLRSYHFPIANTGFLACSSAQSINTAPINLNADCVLGKMRITLSLLLTS
jgi:hypothetical protein